MYVELENFETGWYGVSLGLKKEEIDGLIEQLMNLKTHLGQHFHLTSYYKGEGGIGNIEFYVQEKYDDNMTIMGEAITPT